MVQGWIQIVYADSVDTQSLHKGSVAQTESAIAERIDSGAGLEPSSASRLVANFM